jgi:hypothetical protein
MASVVEAMKLPASIPVRATTYANDELSVTAAEAALAKDDSLIKMDLSNSDSVARFKSAASMA